MIEDEGCHLILVDAVLGRSAGRIVAKMRKGGRGILTNELPALMNLEQTATNPLRAIRRLYFIGISKR